MPLLGEHVTVSAERERSHACVFRPVCFEGLYSGLYRNKAALCCGFPVSYDGRRSHDVVLRL